MKKEATKTKSAGDKLNPKQRKFCVEYLIDFNATQAAIRAGYSKRTARQQGYRSLTKVYIQTELCKLIKKQEIRTGIEADKVLKEAARIALVDIGPAFNKDGTLKHIHDIPQDIRRAISGLEVIEEFIGTGKARKCSGYLKKVKFWSKDKQVENLMRHLGLFLEDNKQAGRSFAAAIHEAYKAI